MQLFEIIDSLLDTFNSIDVRTVAILKDNAWHSFLIVIRFRKETIGTIKKEHDELIRKHCIVQENDFRVDLSVFPVSEWIKIHDDWNKNFICINPNFIINIENKNELCYDANTPGFIGSANYVDPEWNAYYVSSYGNAQELYNKIRTYDRKVRDKFFRSVIEYLGVIFQINIDNIQNYGGSIISIPVFFKISKVVFSAESVILKCTGYPPDEFSFVVNLYKRLGNTTPIPKDKQIISHEIKGESMILEDFEVKIPLDSLDMLDEFRIDVYRKKILISTQSGTIGSYTEKPPEIIQNYNIPRYTSNDTLESKNVDVFLSHADEDRKIAGNLASQLRKHDFNVFVAHDDIEIGEEWESKLKEKIAICDIFLVLLSDNYHKASYTDQEIGIAVSLNKRIFQVRIDETVPYGFVSKYQAKKISSNLPQTEISEISERMMQFSQEGNKIIDDLIDELDKVDSFEDANIVSEELFQYSKFSNDHINKIAEVFLSNDQIRGGWTSRPLCLELFAKNWNVISEHNKAGLSDYYKSN